MRNYSAWCRGRFRHDADWGPHFTVYVENWPLIFSSVRVTR